MNNRLIPLREVCDFVYGDSLKEDRRKPGKFPVYGSNGIVGWHDQPTTKGPTIIVGRKGSIGEINWSDLPCFPIDTTYYIEKTKRPCNLRWLYYALKHLDLTRFNKSAAIPGLSREDAYEKQIIWPTLPEQKRIAGMLAEADRLRRTRRYALALSETFLPAAFHKHFEDNDSKWPISYLGEITVDFSYGTSIKCGTDSTLTPVLRIPNVIGDAINVVDLKYGPVPQNEREQLSLRAGDLLFVRTNGNPDYVGRCAVFGLHGDYCFASYLIRARLDLNAVNPTFLAAYLRMPWGRRAMAPSIRTTAGQHNINVEGLKDVRIALPPLPQQNGFASLVTQREELRLRQREALRQAEHFFNTLLHRAFSGAPATA